MVPENVNSGRSADLRGGAAQKNHRSFRPHDFAGAFDQFALVGGIEKLATERGG
jgi:hypothetical protein